MQRLAMMVAVNHQSLLSEKCTGAAAWTALTFDRRYCPADDSGAVASGH